MLVDPIQIARPQCSIIGPAAAQKHLLRPQTWRFTIGSSTVIPMQAPRGDFASMTEFMGQSRCGLVFSFKPGVSNTSGPD
jgi:hypothetical protein